MVWSSVASPRDQFLNTARQRCFVGLVLWVTLSTNTPGTRAQEVGDWVFVAARQGAEQRAAAAVERSLGAPQSRLNIVRVIGSGSTLLVSSPDQRYRQGDQALQYAKQACQLAGWRRSDCLESLASAYAQLGKAELAQSWNDKALALAKEEQADRRMNAVEDGERVHRPVAEAYDTVP